MMSEVNLISERIANADGDDKAGLCSQLGLHLTYHPDQRMVAVTANPTGACATERVGGGTRSNTTQQTSWSLAS